ncbi:beta-ketoacyl-ACP synthase III [Maridesulfovibrio bastinii]|uniref:beta-ketoacyl-ACP synthase III n=1 Tax=Maridesulfovibrio bastinii TaxID=47157 RepID=UPI00041AA090|nr:beta-ketoacyl-ACP synthase III [Maridesulfovibrio bastinii]
MSINVHIKGLGHHVPEKILSNQDLEKIVDTSDEWITSRTGISNRHIVEDETCVDLAYEASLKALKKAGLEADDLTHIIVATFTGDRPLPSASCLLMERLGIKQKAAMDIAAACSGFVYGLETARAFIALHPESKILVVGSEILTSRVNWKDRSTCVLFGDGAGAAVLTGDDGAEHDGKLLDVVISADGALSMALAIKGGGSALPYHLGDNVGEEYFIEMRGREVFKHAVRNMASISKEVLARHGYTTDDVDVLVPHQANQRIIEAVGKKLSIPVEKVFSNVSRFGNTSAASIPIALSEAKEIGAIKEGDLVLVTTFGGGLTWGSALLQF